jgi:hypothetical protein
LTYLTYLTLHLRVVMNVRYTEWELLNDDDTQSKLKKKK